MTRRGQTILEYTVLFIVFLAAVITAGNYFKRGLQGRIKTAADDFGGDQYDPRVAVVNMLYTQRTNTQTFITMEPAAGGSWTRRVDYTNSVSNQTGYQHIGAYSEF